MIEKQGSIVRVVLVMWMCMFLLELLGHFRRGGTNYFLALFSWLNEYGNPGDQRILKIARKDH